MIIILISITMNCITKSKTTISMFQIAIGVMSAFAVIWAAMKTWSWSRRSGKLAIDPYTLGILLVNNFLWY